jgi:hypothetical protein
MRIERRRLLDTAAGAEMPPLAHLSASTSKIGITTAATARRAGLEHRVERNLDLLLGLLAKRGRPCDVLLPRGSGRPVPRPRSPCAQRRARDRHARLSSSAPSVTLLRHEFRADVKRSVDLLQELTGNAVLGYRAPYFSIKAGIGWPIEQLARLGLTYDSSILAIDRPPGSSSSARAFRFAIPTACGSFPSRCCGCCSSGICRSRAAPAFASSRAAFWIARIARFERDIGSGVFYLHPWELDPDSPTSNAWGRWFLRVGRRRLPERARRVDDGRGLSSRFASCSARHIDGAGMAAGGGRRGVQ